MAKSGPDPFSKLDRGDLSGKGGRQALGVFHALKAGQGCGVQISVPGSVMLAYLMSFKKYSLLIQTQLYMKALLATKS